jgi:D-alanyl-D-alanine carboxypeptidase/D-alanyl-D-alanine carboxypeptidase (penicillin-binding protein 5/6)
MTNSNNLFWGYDGVDGGKTGYNEIERQSVITTATRNNMRVISIILDSPEEDVYEDSTKLLDYGFANYKTGILVKKEQTIETLPVGDKTIDLISPIDVYYTFPIGQDYIKDFEFKTRNNIELPVLKNQIVGAMKYVLKDDTEITVDLYPSANVYSSVDMFSTLVKSMVEYKDIIILVGIELILILLKVLRVLRKVVSRLLSKSKAK